MSLNALAIALNLIFIFHTKARLVGIAGSNRIKETASSA